MREAVAAAACWTVLAALWIGGIASFATAIALCAEVWRG